MASRVRAEAPSKEPRYTVYVRLPFNRGDFVDPPPVDWDEAKSEELWSIISGVAKTEINWDELAAGFGVTVEFLLQMASYLAERHTSQLRAQMRKAAVINTSTNRGSSAPSPVPGPESPACHHQTAAEAIMRTGSAGAGGSGGRAPLALAGTKDAPLSRAANNGSPSGNYNDNGSAPGTPAKGAFPPRPPVSRNSSTTTAVMPASQNLAGGKAVARLSGSHRRRLSSLPISTTPTSVAPPTPQEPAAGRDAETEVKAVAEEADPMSPGLAESSSSSSVSSSSSDSPIESRIIRRPPRFKPQGDGAGGPLFSGEEDDEAEPAFLPFRAQAAAAAAAGGGPSRNRTAGGRGGPPLSATQDLSATLRGDLRDFGRRHPPRAQQDRGSGKDRDRDGDRDRDRDQAQQSQTSDSSASSAAIVSRKTVFSSGGDTKRPGPLSPRRTAELVGRSPGGKSKGYSREGSDGGTPSMGSSFSDLDDASVTQSALEEALASKMQGGTIGSRMSNLGEAIRSRYLPKSGRS